MKGFAEKATEVVKHDKDRNQLSIINGALHYQVIFCSFSFFSTFFGIRIYEKYLTLSLGLLLWSLMCLSAAFLDLRVR